MPKCSDCNKDFKDRQALGNHIKTHLYDSDEDSQDPIDTILHNQNEFNKRVRDISKEIACKRIHFEQQLNDGQQMFDEEINDSFFIKSQRNSSDDELMDEESLSSEEFVLSDDDEFIVSSDEESMASDNEFLESGDEGSVSSDLSYITNVNVNEYTKYDALYSEIPSNHENLYQEFPSKEYAEFMHMITQFRIQDSL